MATEGRYFEVGCTRGVVGDAFSGGVQDYPFSVGFPNAWSPKKSYFRIKMTLSANANADAGVPQNANTPLNPNQLVAFADNACGNMWDNVNFRAGMQQIDACTQNLAQQSAIKVRLGHTYGWLRSMGSAVGVNEASFGKRVMAVSQWPQSDSAVLPSASITQTGFYEEREMFKPYLGINTGLTPGNFATSTVAITAATGVVAGVNTDFTAGMPGQIGGGAGSGTQPTGGPVLPGDILVVNGVNYFIKDVTGVGSLTVQRVGGADVLATRDWFIVRADTIRAPQSFNTVYAIWQPPLGIFDSDKEMGAGDYQISLTPNTNFQLNAVETKDPVFDQSGRSYTLRIDDIHFYAWMEKMSIPDQVRDLDLKELRVIRKAYSPNLQFTVPPSTFGISIFVQDGSVGSTPNLPPSMFKIRNNQDLYLQNIQLTYGGITKPSTNWMSEYKYSQSANGPPPRLTAGANAILALQQRYHDTYAESGLDMEFGGCETFADWLRRGPFYYFSFDRDVSAVDTDVQVNLTFEANHVPPDSAGVFLVAHFYQQVRITTQNGRIANVSVLEV